MESKKFQFNGSNRCVEISAPAFFGGRRGREVIAMLFNDGKHLRFSRDWPQWYEGNEQPFTFLRYRDFCGHGAFIHDVHLQHLGHLHGVDGGRAQVVFTSRSYRWEFAIDPLSAIWIIEFNQGVQRAFASNKIMKLPKQLLQTRR